VFANQLTTSDSLEHGRDANRYFLGWRISLPPSRFHVSSFELAQQAVRRAMSHDPKASLRTRLGKTWPFVLIGLGLVGSIAWVALLGWLAVQFVGLML